MPDYYALLVQKIREAQNDPAKVRELVYETARLALKRHVNVYYPAVSLQDGKRLVGELEAAIERLEADAGGAVRRPVAAEGASILTPLPNHPAPGAALQEFDFRAAFEGKPVASDGADRKPDETPSVPAQGTSDPAAFSSPGTETSVTVAPQADAHPTFALHDDDDTGPERSPGTINRFAGCKTRPAPRRRIRPPFDRGRPHLDAQPAAQSTEDGGRSQVAASLAAQLGQDGVGASDWPQDGADTGPGSHDLALAPDPTIPASRGATYLVRPGPIPARQDEYFRDPPKPQRRLGRRILIGGAIACQVVVVILAGAVFYVANWGPISGPTWGPTWAQTWAPTWGPWGRGASPAAIHDVAAATPHLPAKVPPLVRAAARPDPAVERPGAATLAPTANAAVAPMAAPAFPLPTAYGVYAISDNRLIELEQIAAAPADPRARDSLQIVKPSRTVIADPKLSFIAYRRDLTTNAPDKVPVRIAARVARAMTMDPLGRTVAAPPPTDTWLIRDQGYELRVSPMSETSEMVLLRPDDEEFAFPPGRYELMLGGQSYDFVIAGTITDPAHCVEGVATPRGPAFYECRVP